MDVKVEVTLTRAPEVIGAPGAIEMGLAAPRIPYAAGGVRRAVDHLGREVVAQRGPAGPSSRGGV